MKLLFSFLIISTIFIPITFGNSNSSLILRYDKPATLWEETLPLGNGHLGLMPDGGIGREKLVLNDISMWSGSEVDAVRTDASKYLEPIRRLLIEGKNWEAQQMIGKHFSCLPTVGSWQGKSANHTFGCYQVLGNLDIISGDSMNITDYQRGLDLNTATAYTHFRANGSQVERTYFASRSADVMVIRYKTDSKKGLQLQVKLSRPERTTITYKNNTATMQGTLTDGKGGEGVSYLTCLDIKTTGGKVSSHPREGITIKGAEEVLFFISSSTSLWEKDYQASVVKRLQAAKEQMFTALLHQHITDYKSYFDRVTLNLGKDTFAERTVPERISAFYRGENPAFAVTYFQFGRYLLISSSDNRENTYRPLPLNLQGLWAHQIQTPWNGDYHVNINLQMNYWLAEVANLSDLHRPMLNFIQWLARHGEKTAKGYFNAPGWVVHWATNAWGFTAPGESPYWGSTNTPSGWLCQHLWEHYAFNLEKEYLREVYPTLRGSSAFYLACLVREPKNNYLVMAPSSSPENTYKLNGKNVAICLGSTMDMQIITEVFRNTIVAAEILKIDKEFTDSLSLALTQFPPMKISPKGGYLQEWMEDYEETDPQHRHVSHLYGLYPANLISPNTTPELAEACRVTLNRRGDAGTGWSRGWKINFWARLLDGNRTYQLLRSLLQSPVKKSDNSGFTGAGTYPNLFCAHPPFQIDGNLGGAAGIAEMLIQSHDGQISILPALPDVWKSEGSFAGLRARGGITIDVTWKDGNITSLVINTQESCEVKIKLPDKESRVYTLQQGVNRLLEQG